MTKLSVNVNKIATLRNSRGGNVPDVRKAALDCERFGADGITVHPRPDERHIRYSDVRALRPVLTTEFNIEGNPSEPRFVELVLEVRPHQVTMVPDATDQITSNHGWDTIAHRDELRRLIARFKSHGIRTSIFVDPVVEMVRGAAQTGADRIELYTEGYARDYPKDRQAAVAPYAAAAREAAAVGLGINAGHDLSLENLAWFVQQVPGVLEVSIGHALIADALYLGLENTIAAYQHELGRKEGSPLTP
jgi:pyridoxine 5-phosphate synthase